MEFNLEEAVQVLQSTPRALRSLLENLGERWVHGNYGPETFSPYDVVGHLIHGERSDWIPRARIILEHGPEKTFEPFDRFAMYEESKGKTLAQLLDEFEALREANLRELEHMRLEENDFARRGTHPALGSVTLGQLLATWAVHDLNHIRQIAKAMSYQYREQVGPWKEYLAVLTSA